MSLIFAWKMFNFHYCKSLIFHLIFISYSQRADHGGRPRRVRPLVEVGLENDFANAKRDAILAIQSVAREAIEEVSKGDAVPKRSLPLGILY